MRARWCRKPILAIVAVSYKPKADPYERRYCALIQRAQIAPKRRAPARSRTRAAGANCPNVGAAHGVVESRCARRHGLCNGDPNVPLVSVAFEVKMAVVDLYIL
jgi:hypothetical protein